MPLCFCQSELTSLYRIATFLPTSRARSHLWVQYYRHTLDFPRLTFVEQNFSHSEHVPANGKMMCLCCSAGAHRNRRDDRPETVARNIHWVQFCDLRLNGQWIFTVPTRTDTTIHHLECTVWQQTYATYKKLFAPSVHFILSASWHRYQKYSTDVLRQIIFCFDFSTLMVVLSRHDEGLKHRRMLEPFCKLQTYQRCTEWVSHGSFCKVE